MHFCPLENGGWRDDEEFSNCSAECGGGKKNKIKYCDLPRPSNGGLNCTCISDPKEIDCDGKTATIVESCNEASCSTTVLPGSCMFETIDRMIEKSRNIF